MRKLTMLTNYAPFKNGYFMHILYLIMPIAFYLAHSILEDSYKEVERGMALVQFEFETAIPYVPLFSLFYIILIIAVVAMWFFLMFKDVCAFKRFNISLFVGLFAAIIIAAGYPNYNTLLPDLTEDTSFLSGIVKLINNFDSHTNNMPSYVTIVSGSLIYASFDSKLLNKKWIRITSISLAVLFNVSSVFIKHNSILDIIAGAAIAALLVVPLSLFRRRDMLKIGEERYKRAMENGWEYKDQLSLK